MQLIRRGRLRVVRPDLSKRCQRVASGDVSPLASRVQPEQQSLQVRALKDDLQFSPGGLGLRITARSQVSVYAVSVQKHQSAVDLSLPRVPCQEPPCFLDDCQRVAAASDPNVQMQVQSLVFATTLQEPCEGSFAFSLDPDENDSPAFDRAATPHRPSSDLREAAEHSSPVLRVQPSVAPEAANVLCAVHAGRTVTVLFDDEKFLFLQIVKQPDVVRRD